MRVAARKAPGGAQGRREQLTSEHLRADPLRKLFPHVEQLRIELVFNDLTTHSPAPSAQVHTLFASAPAFFRFACPCADCDGNFDLTDAVTGLLTSAANRKRAASFTGQLSCRGVRFRDHAAHQGACSMQLSFRVLAEPAA